MRWRSAASWMLLVAAVTSGCSEDLPSATAIQDTRILGARIEVAGDDEPPFRAWPKPGETARVRFAVVSDAPDFDPSRLSSAFLICGAAGGLFCTDETDPTRRLRGMDGARDPGDLDPSDLDPQLASQLRILFDQEPRFEVELDGPLADVDELLILGVICDGGRPQFDTEAQSVPLRCESTDAETEADTNLVTFTAPVQTGEETNYHPQLGEARLFFDNEPWSAPPEALDDCLAAHERDPEAMPLARLSRDEIELRMQPPELAEEAAEEELTLAHFTTAGEMERKFSVRDSDMPMAGITVPWILPAPEDVEPPAVVRFFFTARDGRGGFDMIERTACMLEPDAGDAS